jgi:hypothetical protein
MIDLGDQSFLGDIGRINRADLGAGRVITLHARSWKQSCFDVRIFPFDIGDQVDPMDRAALCSLLGSNNGHVILRLACNHASLACRALV